ncbi:MAG: bactofilin family protein [Bacteroidota bacterium]
MRINVKVLISLLVLALLLVPTGSASARGASTAGPDGKVIFGSDFVLKSGETLGGDLVVFGGNVSLEKDSAVNGSVAVIGGNVDASQGAAVNGDVVAIGGNLEMDGKINGNLVLVGGRVSLESNALVDGDITTIGGQLQRAAGAQVTGNIVNNPAPPINIPSGPQLQNPPAIPRPSLDIRFDPFAGFLGVVGRAIAVALIAVVASLFLQPQMERVSSTILSQPVLAGSFGLLTLIVSLIAMAIMAVTLILIPVSGLGAAVLVLAWLFGLVAMGHEVGERFGRRLNQSWTVPVSAGLGTLLLMLVVGVVGLVPCIGWVVPVAVGLAGLGGVVLTYLNARRPPLLPTQPDLPPAS